MKKFIWAISYTLVGFAAGWWLRDPLMSEPTDVQQDTSVAHEIPAVRRESLQRPVQTDFDRLIANISDAEQEGRLEFALDTLLAGNRMVRTQGQQDVLMGMLDGIVEKLVRQHVGANRYDLVDELYEVLTFEFPDLGRYHLLLGQLRIRMGNELAALPVLAQITNHTTLGAEARRLMEQIEASEVDIASSVEVPLVASGQQFLVRAQLDGRQSVVLLIDTGAVMTVLHEPILRQMGYNLSGKQEYFVTAGGVVSAPVVTLDSVQLGAARVEQLAVGAMGIRLSPGIDGLLGMNFLRHFEFQIDQAGERLLLDQR